MDNHHRFGFVLVCLFFESVTAIEPFLVDRGNNVTATQGDRTVLLCSIANLTDSYQVNWTHPSGEQLTSGKTVLKNDTRLSLQGSWDLHISNVYYSDSGTYICEISTVPPRQSNVSLTVLSSLTTSEPTTEDPNKCSESRPCENSGTCDAGICTCSAGYTGLLCETPTICPPGYCNINNSRNCTVEMESGSTRFKCNCYPFYEGTQCEIYNYCETFPCQNRGYCQSLKDGYSCKCRTGDPYNDCKLNTGDNCVARPPSSKNSYITCIDRIDSFTMYCSPGYAGEKEGCRYGNQDPQMFCNQKGIGYCTDEGFCKPLCNVDSCNGTKNCEFTANPYNTTGFHKKPDCMQAFGDGYDQPHCHGEETLFDGFDVRINNLLDCSPFLDTICTRDFGNGDCKPECNNDDCLFDGFDCLGDNRTELAGVVIVELKDRLGASLGASLVSAQKNMSLMLRSGVNFTVESYPSEPSILLQLKIADTEFTNIEYAGKFLAAAIAKRPEWLEGIKITDIYACPAGKYSRMYADKCDYSCGACVQEGDICDWKTGECLNGCQHAHWGANCTSCDMCVQKDEVCEYFTGKCLFGCKPGHYGDMCLQCPSTCKNESDICNNTTGECLHGCISNDFYGAECRQCPENCVGGCNDLGLCNNCSSGWYGTKCTRKCDTYCQNDTCDASTGVCDCKIGNYWHKKWCEFCSTGCTSACDVMSGHCNCRDGYYGSKCDFHCRDKCLNGTCYINGTCDLGCDMGFYGPICTKACPSGCNGCSRDAGECSGDCKSGFAGFNCEEKAKKSGYIEDVTDNTGVIIGIIISLLLVGLIIFVSCCYWRKRQSGDYVMEDEEKEEQVAQDSESIEVHTNMHLQPKSPLLAHSMDMIELDEKTHTVVYAGPGQSQAVGAGNNFPNDMEPIDKGPEVNTAEPADDKVHGTEDEKADDKLHGTEDEKADDKLHGTEHETTDDTLHGTEHETADNTNTPEGRKERCMSSVTMEIGIGGRVLSVSDGDEVHSPTLNKEVELTIGEEADAEADEDDSAFTEPPHSPLGEVRAPLASEENILASLGPQEVQYNQEDEPVTFGQEAGGDSKEEDKDSHRSRSSSSASSTSKSSKGSNQEINTEM